MWSPLPGGAINKDMVLIVEKLNSLSWQPKQIKLKTNCTITLQGQTSLGIFHLYGIFPNFSSLFWLAAMHIIQQDALFLLKGVKTATFSCLLQMWSMILNPVFLWNRDDSIVVLKRVLHFLEVSKQSFKELGWICKLPFHKKHWFWFCHDPSVRCVAYSSPIILGDSIRALVDVCLFFFHPGGCCDGGWLPMVFSCWMYASCFSFIGYKWLACEMLCIWWEYLRYLNNIQKCIAKSYGCYR